MISSLRCDVASIRPRTRVLRRGADSHLTATLSTFLGRPGCYPRNNIVPTTGNGFSDIDRHLLTSTRSNRAIIVRHFLSGRRLLACLGRINLRLRTGIGMVGRRPFRKPVLIRYLSGSRRLDVSCGTSRGVFIGRRPLRS